MDIEQEAMMPDLWLKASDIWATCRGLGWTLDSERAIKMIYERLAEAVADAQKCVEHRDREIDKHKAALLNVKRMMVMQRKEHESHVADLKAVVKELNKEIEELKDVRSP